MSQVLKTLADTLENCKKAGIEKDCLRQIQVSEIVQKGLTVIKNNPANLDKDIGDLVKKEVLSVIDVVGNITLRDLYDKYKTLNATLDIKYINIGWQLLSYGVLLRAYNKHIHSRPYDKHLTSEELVLARQIRHFTRFWVAGLIIPVLLVGVKGFIKNTNYITININTENILDLRTNNNIDENRDIENNTTKNGIFSFLATMWKKASLRVLIILWIILTWFCFEGFSENVFLLYKHLIYYSSYFNIEYVLYILIIIPIVLNLIAIILLTFIEKNGGMAIPKYIPSFLKVILTYCVKIGTKKESLDYFRGSGYADMYFFIVLLIISIIIFNFIK